MTDQPHPAFDDMNQRIETAVELEQTMAACRTLTPALLNGLADNCDWLLRRCFFDLEFADEENDDDDDEFGGDYALQLSPASTRKLLPYLATTAKGLRDFAELLSGLEAFRAENAA